MRLDLAYKTAGNAVFVNGSNKTSRYFNLKVEKDKNVNETSLQATLTEKIDFLGR